MTEYSTAGRSNELPQREPGTSGYEKFLTGNVFHAVYQPPGGWPKPSEELFNRMWTGLHQLP